VLNDRLQNGHCTGFTGLPRLTGFAFMVTILWHEFMEVKPRAFFSHLCHSAMYPLQHGFRDAQGSVPAFMRWPLASQDQNAWLILKEFSYRI